LAEDKKGFLLRLPPPLLDELRRWAAHDMRSLNGQIEWLLRDALVRRLGKDPTAEKGAAQKRDE
jgi:hypothetical protein